MNRACVGLLAVVLAGAAEGADTSKRLLVDPSAAHRVDYLILAGDAFADAVEPLVAHREKQGYAVGVVRMSAVKAKFPSIRAFLAHAVTKWEKPAPSYLLLVGDTDAVPAVVKQGAFAEWMSDSNLATDFDYARPLDRRILLHVGRFPCDTADELALMIRKTIDYETTLPGGAWQRQLHFIASVGGFGKEIDALLEGLAMTVIAGSVPPAFDIRAAYGSPHSPFCPYPPKFNARVIEMFNAGSLLTVFVGHGLPDSVASIDWRGRSYPIFRAADAKALDCKAGLPVLVVIACHTGRYDASDCLGETFLKAERGPVAFIGGSRVTQPYGNGVFSKAFVDAFFGEDPTLGAVLSRAKASVLANPFSVFRLQADALAAAAQGGENLAAMRQDVVEHYNLLGDPALVIRRPRADIQLTVKGGAVHVRAPGRTEIDLSLECDRATHLHDLPEIAPDDPDFEQKMAARYEKALDKVIRRWKVKLENGVGTAAFDAPTKPGRYFLKASAGPSVGAMTFAVPPDAPR